MIDIDLKKEDCNGCNTCTVSCPVKCISMPKDEEGFFYPKVDWDVCIECHICIDVCPEINRNSEIKRYDEPLVFAAYHKDQEIRLDSTSGGIFSALANKIFDIGGYVCGAVYNSDYSVSHILTNKREKLPDIRSSKYLQSFTESSFVEIRTLLKTEKKVLICAAPCQISGLYNFLGKDHDNLITCDFICRGVNSPKVFQKYMYMLENQYDGKATKIKFKNKTYGWHRFSMKVDFDNGRSYCKDRYHDLFFIGYLQSGNFSRPACYDCKFKGFPQDSDITLADFWGIENIDPSMDQDMGTSLVMINSDKGKKLFDNLDDVIESKQFSIEEAKIANPLMNESLKSISINRKDFFSDLDNFSFDAVAKKYFPLPNLKNKLRRKLLKLKIIPELFDKMGLSIHTWKNFIYINFVGGQIKKSKRIAFIPLKYCRLSIAKSSQLILNSKFVMGTKQVKSSHLETRMLLEPNSKLIINGDFEMYCNSYIRVIEGGELILNKGFINENVQITCASRIDIGEGCTIGRDVIIRDYDGHIIEDPDFEISKPITIGKHVWIGNRATILKGVSIGEGAVIASGTIVTKDIPANCVAAGIPAKIIKENIRWRE